MAEENLTCPFCGHHADTEYAMLYHMESRHAEGKSPFMVEEGASGSASGTAEEEDPIYAPCPVDGCGEIVARAELNYHIDLHVLEEDDELAETADEGTEANEHAAGYNSPYGNQENIPPPSGGSKSRQVDSRNRHTGSVQKWKQLLAMPSGLKGSRTRPLSAEGVRKRLGKSELGRYAHEDKMPDWLVRLLRSEGQIICGDILPVIGQLLQQSPTTSHAYLCHPAVDHISKLKREGGFCGYRNIQMLSSYIIGSRAVGAAHFDGRLPSIFKIQDYVENAWDQGINAQGRVETGGIKGTRKYIGTPEAQAMFLSLDIPCEAQGFKDPRPGAAEARLMLHVQEYFEAGDFDPRDKVRYTSLPPIYFQHRGHSMTIVGFERRKNGATELLVFDPMFHDSSSITKYLGRPFKHKSPDNALKLYRRGAKYLKRYHEFELLKLTSRLSTTETHDHDDDEGPDDNDEDSESR